MIIPKCRRTMRTLRANKLVGTKTVREEASKHGEARIPHLDGKQASSRQKETKEALINPK